jgi:hypothetical protein
MSDIASTVTEDSVADESAPLVDGGKVASMTLLSRAFWTYATERVIKSFAYSLNGLLVTSGVGLIKVDWAGVLSVSGLAALSSLLVALSSFKDV